MINLNEKTTTETCPLRVTIGDTNEKQADCRSLGHTSLLWQIHKHRIIVRLSEIYCVMYILINFTHSPKLTVYLSNFQTHSFSDENLNRTFFHASGYHQDVLENVKFELGAFVKPGVKLVIWSEKHIKTLLKTYFCW